MAHSDEVIEFARDLYVRDGLRPTDISRELKTEMSVDVPTATIYNWIKTKEWEQIKGEIAERSIDKLIGGESGQIAETIANQLSILKKAGEKTAGAPALLLDDPNAQLQFTNPRDGIDSLLKIFKAERDLQSNQISRLFIQAVYSSVAEEINDEDTLIRIGHRLKTNLAELMEGMGEQRR